MQYKPSAGESIKSACEEAVALASHYNQNVNFSFNSIGLVATPKSDPNQLANEYLKAIAAAQKAYETSPEGIAAKEKRQVEVCQKQADVDNYLKVLPDILKIKDQNALIGWLKMFAFVADDVAVKFNHIELYDQLDRAGYTKNYGVGNDSSYFNDKSTMAHYIVGQAMNCLKSGLPPHPVLTEKFCDEYFNMK